MNSHTLTTTLFLLCLTMLTLSAAPEAGSVTYHAATEADSFIFTPAQAKNGYIADYIRWAIEDDGNLPRREAVLAVGSSSMRMWRTIKDDLAPAEIVHRGFGGSKMISILRMMIFFQRYECAKVLVYEGDNDLLSDKTSVDTYIEQCHTFIEAILETRSDTEIYFISTKPSPARVKVLEKYKEANRRIEAICAANDQLHYIDVFSPMMVDADTVRNDIFSNDRIHMNKEGYQIWTHAVREALEL